MMNNERILLFRGQRDDSPLTPTLFRDQWKPPFGRYRKPVPLVVARKAYWDGLTNAESVVLPILKRQGLPRWRHFRDYPQARWAVIQHYELWPTPLLDFTSSLRVAASFAFGCDRNAPEGFLYIVGVSQVWANLMDLSVSPAP